MKCDNCGQDAGILFRIEIEKEGTKLVSSMDCCVICFIFLLQRQEDEISK